MTVMGSRTRVVSNNENSNTNDNDSSDSNTSSIRSSTRTISITTSTTIAISMACAMAATPSPTPSFGGWPRLSLASPTQRGARPSRFLRRAGVGMLVPCGLITCPQQNQLAHAASPPTLSKKRRGGTTSAGMVHAKIVKGGPPAGSK